ncbi:MAG: aminodeoxychorismate synthase component I [Candidatus Omnitrophota bacterium]|jgi:para-aminobenzoate synthetase component 1
MARSYRIEEIGALSSPIEILGNLQGYPYSFFLDSSYANSKFGRYSLLGCDPFLVFKSKNDSIAIEYRNGRKMSFKGNPFSVLKDLLKQYRTPGQSDALPLGAGAVGYFSYDLKQFIEKLPDIAHDDLGLPDCIAGFYDNILTYDNLKKRAYLSGIGPKSRANEFMDACAVVRHEKKTSFSSAPLLESNFTRDSYVEAVKKAKDYIRMGDIYQVNLSQRFEAELVDIDQLSLYSRLRRIAPAPFSSYLDFKDVSILSSSPERFLFKRGRYIETRPIKGTRPRGDNRSADYLLGRELKESAKDNAEHIMIVDLERNDLGRICEYGSVKLAESAALEKYSNVFHLTSTVTGHLKKGIDAIDCLTAAFPGGSITGAPKIRSMEIIEELEPVKRSAYTGGVGYISFDGNMDTSIVIRTLIAKGRKIYFSVGGGIVADSVPEKEYDETLDKAKGLLAALGAGLTRREVALV